MTEVDVVGVPAPVVRRLRGLLDEAGALTIDAVLEDAADAASPLHHLFEWDDSEAAVKYRQGQARQLIARVRVKVITDQDSPPLLVRAYVSRTDIGKAGEGLPSGAYLPIEDVAGATEAEASVLRGIKRDIARLRSKYRGFEVLLAQELAAAD